GRGRAAALRRARRRDDQERGKPDQPNRDRGSRAVGWRGGRGSRVRSEGRAAGAGNRRDRARRRHAGGRTPRTAAARVAELHAADALRMARGDAAQRQRQARSRGAQGGPPMNAPKASGPIPAEFAAGLPDLDVWLAHGTPLYVYDFAVVKARIARLRAAL